MTLPLIEAEGLTRHYRSGEGMIAALDRVTVSIPAGAFVAAMGPSGSGKSTFLNLVGCLDRPSAGRLRLFGEDVGALRPDRLAELRGRRIGFVFQSFQLLPRLDALANVEMPLAYRGMPRRLRRDMAAAALDRMGLGERLHHRPSQLSGGQQQRVAIARAVVGKPDLLLADEPTGALDSRTGRQILGLLRGLNAWGVTVLIVTHDAAVAHAARRQLRFADGRLVEDSDAAAGRPAVRVSA